MANPPTDAEIDALKVLRTAGNGGDPYARLACKHELVDKWRRAEWIISRDLVQAMAASPTKTVLMNLLLMNRPDQNDE